MGRFLGGVGVGVLVAVIGAYAFLTRGGMPVAARHAQALPLERLLTHQALAFATADAASRTPPIPADEANLLAGARLYRNVCATCHGTPDEAHRSAVAAGMFPRPPPLLAPGKGVTDDPVGETYWKVRHGIRLSGMPGFEGSIPDTTLWQVALLLKNAHHLPASVQAALR